MSTWEHPFLQKRPYIRPSLNRARIVDLPGINLPLEVRGKHGYGLLGAAILRKQIVATFPALRNEPDPIRAFAAYLEPEHPASDTAVSLAQTYGRSLGYLLLMLKRGDPVNRVVRRDWENDHWAHWGHIKKIWVGGGLAAGRLGMIAVAAANDLLTQHHFPDVTIRQSPWAAYLPLLGVGRTAPATATSMLVFDLGQTTIKRAIAVYTDMGLVGLHHLPGLPAVCGAIQQRSDPILAQQTADFLVRCFADTWCEAQAAGWSLCPTLAASIACYLVDGHPALPEDMDCYGRLQLLTDHLTRYLADRASQEVGTSLALTLYHDGTAAAMAYAGEQETAVLTLGTAIGNGFPPPADGLRSLNLPLAA